MKQSNKHSSLFRVLYHFFRNEVHVLRWVIISDCEVDFVMKYSLKCGIYKGIYANKIQYLSRDMRFPTMWYVQQAKPQISLRIGAVWSEPLLVTWIFYDCSATDWISFGVPKLEGDCTGSSESTVVKMPHCWKSYVRLIFHLNELLSISRSKSRSASPKKGKFINYLMLRNLSWSYLSNSYTMGCPSVRGDNPRALASGLSYVQVYKHVIAILYHLHQFRPCTSRDISC